MSLLDRRSSTKWIYLWQAELLRSNNSIVLISIIRRSESWTHNWICLYVMQLVIVGSDLINPFIYSSMFHSFLFIDYRELLSSTDSVSLVDLSCFFVKSANLFLRLGFLRCDFGSFEFWNFRLDFCVYY
jgi:hypothetical protein